ncbi:hypothetical protein GCM10027613_39790 [Microlunatus endophyticus]
MQPGEAEVAAPVVGLPVAAVDAERLEEPGRQEVDQALPGSLLHRGADDEGGDVVVAEDGPGILVQRYRQEAADKIIGELR